MNFEEAKVAAANKLIAGATLDELREAARDLRALSPDSALADLVDAKIDRILANCDGEPIGFKEYGNT